MFATQFTVAFPIFHSMLRSAIQPVPDDREKRIDLSFVWLDRKDRMLTLVGCNLNVIHAVSFDLCATGPDFSFAWRKYTTLSLSHSDRFEDFASVRIDHDEVLGSGTVCITSEGRLSTLLAAHPAHHAPPAGKIMGMIPTKWKKGTTKFRLTKAHLQALVTPPATVKLTTKGMPLASDYRLMATWDQEVLLPRKGSTGIPTQSDMVLNTAQVQTWLAGIGDVADQILVRHDPEVGLMLQATRGDLTFTHFSAAIVRE